MPSADLIIAQYIGTSPAHKWVLYDKGSLKKVDSDRFPIYTVVFSGMANIWECSCSTRSNCDHIIFVAQHIAQKAGPWERDKVLMEWAWKVAVGEGQKYRVRRLNSDERAYRFLVFETGARGESKVNRILTSDLYWCEECASGSSISADINGCEHITAVRQFEENGKRKEPPFVTADPAASLKRRFERVNKNPGTAKHQISQDDRPKNRFSEVDL